MRVGGAPWAVASVAWLAACGGATAAIEPPPTAPPAPVASVVSVAGASTTSQPPPLPFDLEPTTPPLRIDDAGSPSRARAWSPPQLVTRELAHRGQPFASRERLLVVDADTSTLLALPGGEPISSAQLPTDGRMALGLFVTAGAGALSAFDLALGRRRFHRDLELGRGAVRAIAASGSTIVACVDVDVEGADRKRRLVAVDGSTGTVAWKVDLHCARLAAAGPIVVVDTGREVLGIELARSSLKWAVRLAGDDEESSAIAADATHAVVARLDGGKRWVHVLRPSDGSVLGRHVVPAAPRVEAIAVDGGLAVLVAASTTGGEVTRARTVAIDLVRSRLEWSSRSAEVAGTGTDARVALDDDVMFHCVHDGILRVASRATGRELAQLGLGSCDAVSFDRPTPDAPLRVVARSRAFSATVDDSRVVIAERGAASNVEHAHVTGLATANARIRVHDRVVRAGADGRYDARIDARGVVTVEGFATKDAFPIGSVAVRLDGRTGVYDVPMPYASHSR